MIEEIFLRRATIAGFRGLPDGLDVRFSEQPGVTIFVGPNGSGKSRVIDAIEWALTGGSARLPSLPPAIARNAPDPFRTLHSEEFPRVELEFVGADGPTLLRSDDGSDKVADLLKRKGDDWQRVKNVARALQQTHFSSQRAAMRLAYEEEDANALIDAFAAPSNLERLRSLGDRLWGTETRSAFRDLQRETQERTEKIRRDLDTLDRLVDAQAQENRSSTEISRKRLTELLGRLPAEIMPVDVNADIDEIERTLLDRRGAIETVSSALRELVIDLRSAASTRLILDAELEAARESSITAERLLASRQSAAIAAREEANTASAQFETLSIERDRIDRQIAAAERRDALRQIINAADIRLQDFRGRHDKATARLAGLARFQVVARRYRAARAIEELKQSEAALLEQGHPLEMRDELVRTINALRPQVIERAAARDTANDALVTERERLTAIAGYAAALAEQLDPHDLSCPVCAATYEKGVLAARATEQAQRLAKVEVADRARRLTDATQELGRVEGALRLAQSRLQETERMLAQLLENQAEQKREHSAFGPDWSAETVAEVSAAFFDLHAQSILDGETITAAISQATEDVQQLDRIVSSTLEDQNRASAELLQISSDIPDSPEIAALAASQLQLRGDLLQAENRLKVARETFEHASRLAANATSALQQAQADLAAREAAAAASAAHSAEQSQRLQAITNGIPEADFQARQRTLSALYDQALATVTEIRAAEHRIANASSMFERETAYLRERHDAGAEAELPKLRELIATKLEESIRAEQTVDQLGKRLSAKARTVRERDRSVRRNELGPWNTLFNLVYTNLAGSSRERLELTTGRKVDMRRPGVEAHRTPTIDHLSLEGWKPVHYFSEGQVAALQISNIVTASIMYPWSRWKALLFDDPLQHADVIKVNAFSDLIRGLCLDMGHQIILTTHDEQQADFIAAKFDAVGLDVTQVPFERRVMPRASAPTLITSS